MTAHAQELMKRADQEHLATRLTLAGLGLTEVQDTFVGNADVRGVSGGQRRRVTVGEVRLFAFCVLAPIFVTSQLNFLTLSKDVDIWGAGSRGRRDIHWS
jgi:hypothetical protein